MSEKQRIQGIEVANIAGLKYRDDVEDIIWAIRTMTRDRARVYINQKFIDFKLSKINE